MIPSASSAEDSGPAGAAVIFLGSAEEERRGYTRFDVIEVWEAPDPASEVWLSTGQEQPPWPRNLFSAVGSSTDAVLARGDRFVVGAPEAFSTDDCSIDTGFLRRGWPPSS